MKRKLSAMAASYLLLSLVQNSIVPQGSNDAANHPACRASGGGFNISTMSLSLRPIALNTAMCTDGSAAKMYVRTCCDGTDPGDFCNNTERIPQWVVVFGDGNSGGWCWDGPSCAARLQQQPDLSSSKRLPEYFARDGGRDDYRVGIFSKSGEGNPNFYASYTAYVPYCSSDLFLGNSSGEQAPFFRGRSIALGAIDSLRDEMLASAVNSPGRSLQVVIVGGAGVMLLMDDIRARLPPGADLSAVCDGCVLFDDGVQSDRAKPAPCKSGDAFSCTPSMTLPAATGLWAASMGACGAGWRCLLDSPARVASGLKPPRLLAQQPLYDAPTRAAHAGMLDAAVRARLTRALAAAGVSVGAACSRLPSASITRSSFFSVTFGGSRIPPLTYGSGLYSLLVGTNSSLVDTCEGVDCNPHCPTPTPKLGSGELRGEPR